MRLVERRSVSSVEDTSGGLSRQSSVIRLHQWLFELCESECADGAF